MIDDADDDDDYDNVLYEMKQHFMAKDKLSSTKFDFWKHVVRFTVTVDLHLRWLNTGKL